MVNPAYNGSIGDFSVAEGPIGAPLTSSKAPTLTGVAGTGLAATQNILPNPQFAGVVTGSPGTLPTGWSTHGPFNSGLGRFLTVAELGLTQTIVGSGYLNGLGAYVDINFTGTGNSTAGENILYFVTSSNVSIASSTAYNAAAYVAYVGGSLSGVAGFELQWDTYDSSATYLNSTITGFTPGTSLAQYTAPATSPSTAAQSSYEVILYWTSGTGPSINITVRYCGLQFYQGSTFYAATADVLPLVTGAAGTSGVGGFTAVPSIGSYLWSNSIDTSAFAASTSTDIGSTNALGSNGTFTQGDFLIAVLLVGGTQTGSFTGPSGWTLATEGTHPAGTVAIAAWTKIAGASESGSYTVSWPVSAVGFWYLFNYGQPGTFDVASNVELSGSGGSPNCPVPSLTLATTNETVFALWGYENPPSGTTITPPVGFTTRLTYANSNYDAVIVAADGSFASSGATGTISATLSPNNFNPNSGVAISIKPSVGAGPGNVSITVSSTGVAGTGAAGTLTVARVASASPTGVNGTGQAGSVTASVSDTGSPIGATGTGAVGISVRLSPNSLTGAAGTGQAGTLTTKTDDTASITGVNGTGQAGSLTAQIASSIAGVSGTGQAGSASTKTDDTGSPTGVVGSGQAGSLGASISASIAGISGTGQAGTLTTKTDDTGSATGVAGTGQSGSLTPQIAPSIAGVAGTGQAGSASTETDDTGSITGVNGTGQAGSLTVQVTLSIVGVTGTGQTGSVTPQYSDTASLTGVSGTGQSGAVAPQVAPSVTGASGTGQTGSFTLQYSDTGTLTGASGTASATSLSGGSFSRASNATYVDAAGNLVEVGSDYLRPQYVSGVFNGPLIESSSTNYIPNPRGEGGTIGTLGSGGVAPTGYSVNSVSGITRAYLGQYIVNGVTVTRWHFFGTTTATGPLGVNPWRGAAIISGMGANQALRQSFYARLVAGSTAGFSGIDFWGDMRDSLNASTGNVPQAPYALSSTLTQFSEQWNTLSGGTPPYSVVGMGTVMYTTGIGAVIDITVDFGGWQLELGPTLTSVMLPPVGSPAAYTRATDTISPTGFEFVAAALTGVSGTSSVGFLDSASPIGVSATGSATGLGSGTFTRASNATYLDASSYLVEVGNNYLRPNYVGGVFSGPLIEASSTNGIRNPRGEGAIVNTTTLPTNWQVLNNASGSITFTVVGQGRENGIPYTDIRINGTPTNTACRFEFEQGGIIPASDGQTWTGSVYWKLQGGSLTNLTGIFVEVQCVNGSGSAVSGGNSHLTVPTSASLSSQRYTTTPTLASGGTVASIRLNCVPNITSSGVPFDVTLRIGGPQLEQASSASSLILPPAGSPSQYTRASETIGSTGIEWILASPNGAASTGQAGTITPQYSDTASPTGVAGAGQIGAVTPQLTASIAGIASTSQAGTLTTRTDDTTSATGVSATGQAGTLTTRTDDTTSATGVTGTGQAGTLTTRTDDTTPATGVAGTGQVGIPNIEVDVSPIGVSGYGLAAEQASLELHFLTVGSLDSRLTFSRASTATYFDSTGTMQTASANTPRWDYNPTTLALNGLLLEQTRTNSLLNSATLSTQSVTVTAIPYALSFYGTGTVTLSGAYSGTLVGSGAYPTRSVLSFTPSAGTLTLTVSGSVSNAQLEAATSPHPSVITATSYIPTTASPVTRQGDSLSMSVGTWLNPNQGSVAIEAIGNECVAWNGFWELWTDGNNAQKLYWDGTGPSTCTISMAGAYGGMQGVNAYFATGTAGTILNLGTSFNNTQDSAVLNGGTVTTITAPLEWLQLAPVTTLYIGGNVDQLNGWVRRFRYWPELMSSSDLITITSGQPLGEAVPNVNVVTAGVTGTGQIGTFIPKVAASIVGVASTAQVSSGSPVDTIALTGVSAIGQTGIASPPVASSIVGAAGTSQVGTSFVEVDVSPIGVSGYGLAAEQASLDLNFLTPGTLDSRITFSRASPATYIDATGTMQTVGNDTPRWDYDPVTHVLNGLLIEQQRTNLLVNSDNLVTQSVTVTAQTYVLSFYGVGLVIFSGASNGNASGLSSARTSFVFTPSAGTLTLTVSGSLTNAQLEAGTRKPTSYISSGATPATRQADLVTMPVGPWLNPVEGSVAVEAYSNENNSFNGFYQFADNSPIPSPNSYQMFFDGIRISTSVRNGGTLVTNADFGLPHGATALNIATSFNASTDTGVLLGGAATSVAWEPLPTVTQLQIGWQDTYQLNGWMRRLRYWPTALGSGDLQTITSGLPLGEAVPNVNVNISGVAVTGAAGALGASPNASITGVSTTGSVGTITPQIAPSFVGTTGTGQVGTATDQNPGSIIGMSASGHTVAVTVEIDILLTGVAATGNTQGVSLQADISLLGVTAITQIAALATAIADRILGVSASSAANQLLPDIQSQDMGQAGIGQAGTLVDSVSTTIVGCAGTGEVGDSLGDVACLVTGGFGTAGVGSLGIEIDTILIGADGVGEAGFPFVPGHSQGTIVGVAGIGSSDEVFVEIDVSIDGAQGNSAAGSLSQRITTIAGAAGDGQSGSFIVELDVSATGTEGTGQIDEVTGQLAVHVAGVTGTGEPGGTTAQITAPIAGVSGTGQVDGATPDVAIVLTGVAATGDAATVEGAKALPGAAGTAIAAALSDEVDAVLTGAGASASASTVTVSISEAGTVTVTGVEGDGAAGSVTVQISGTASVSGVAGIGTAGDLSDLGLASADGAQGLGAAGSLAGVEIDGTILGTQGVGGAGTIVIGQSVNISIIGVEAVGAGAITSIEIDAPITGDQATGAAGSLALTRSGDVPITGVQGVGDAETISAGRSPSVPITGVQGNSASGDSADVVGASVTGIQGIGYAGPAVGQIAINNVPITGVQGTGAAGQVLQGKKKRSGRGANIRFKPALFSRPDRHQETDAEAIARYRKIVDDLLAQPPLPSRQAPDTEQPEPDDRTKPPDFSFLASLEQAEKPDVAPAIMSWHAQAMEEDRLLLLGDASGVIDDLVRAEDDLLLNELFDD